MSPMNLRSARVPGHWFTRLAWVPLPVLLTAMLVLGFMAPQGSYESQLLLMVLNFLFSTVASLLVAILIGRSYLVRGSPGLLLLGCGVVMWGAAGTISPVLLGYGPNTTITIHNSLVWLSSLCHLAGVLLSLRVWRASHFPGLTVVMAYTGAACVAWLVTLVALEGWMPLFFVQGQGGTAFRQLVLGSSIAMFLFTSTILWMGNRPLPSVFVRFYTLALLLVSVGLLGIMVQSVFGSLLGWTGRVAQVLGGAYMLVAGIASVRESRAWRLPIEEALREQTLRYELVVAGANAAIWDWDVLNRRVAFSPQWKALRGYAEDEVSDREEEWSGGIHPEDAPRVMAAVQEHFDGKTPFFAEEYRVRQKDGSWMWIADRGLAYRDTTGRVVRMAGSEADITERKQAEEALQASRAELLQAQRVAHIGSWTWDARTDKGTASDELLRIFGFDPARQTIPNFADQRGLWYPPEEWDRLNAAVQESARTGVGYDLEVQALCNGQRIWVQTRSEAMRDAEGRIVGLRGTVQDFTERKHAEDRIRHQNAIQEGISRLFREALTCETEEELGGLCLRVAEELTQSRFGFIGEIGQDGLLHDIAISNPGWELCTMYDQCGHRRPPGDFKLHGLYGRVLLDGKSLLTNDPSSHPNSIGTPEGHPPLRAFLGVPLIQNGRTIGVVATGNREGGYTQDQQDALESIAQVMVEALLRKRAEEAFRESRAKLDAALSSMTDAVFISDAEGRFIDFNDAFATFHKFRSKDECRKTLAEYPEILDVFMANGELAPLDQWAVPRALRGETVTNAEYTLRRKDTRETWVGSYSFGPIRDQGGAIVGSVVVGRDITELKRAEKALRESEERFRVMANSIPQLAWTAGADGYIYWYNQRWYEYTGTTPDQMEGWGWQSVHDPVALPGVLERWNKSVATGEPFDMVFPLRGADGKFRQFLTRVQPVKNAHGEVIQWCGTNTDITERKLMEDELRRSRDELELRVEERTAEIKAYMAKLEESNKALQDFASIASHDLQEPLRKVIAFGDRLKTKCSPSLGEEGCDYLDRMQSAIKRMQALIQSLLDYSRVTTRAAPFTDVHLDELVRDVLVDLEVRMDETGGRLEVGDLPVIHADSNQMRQVIQNLIGNALKYRREDEKPVVRVFGGSEYGFHRIVVEDNGIGFDERYLEKIFQPFQRLHGRTSQFEGTGMGLAICRKIVERHGGTITARSAPGKGSTFVVTLPREQAERNVTL